ncbi:MAG: DUF2939 domain-containing protein [Pseudomonadota bacterium]|nr:DUF2939 domain-containing protein [Pseudomonadota bacterium]
MKKLLLLLMILIAAVYVQPYWVAYQIQQAIENNDQAKMARYIDFDAVRSDLKQQLQPTQSSLVQALGKNSMTVHLAGLATDKMLDMAVDQLVSPAGLSQLIAGQQAWKNWNAPTADMSEPTEHLPHANSTDSPLADEKASPKFGYTGLNQFKIRLNPDQHYEIGLYLQRSGLGWQLVRVQLPVSFKD